MAQMTQDELWNWILSSPYSGMVSAGKNPGSLSLQTGPNEGYITSFTAPPGYFENQAAQAADPAGFGTPQYVAPSDWTPSISNMTYVPDWNKAIKDANNGGFLADYGWMLPLAIAAGGPMLGGMGGAGAAGAAEAGSGLSWLGNAGLATPAEAAASLGAGTATGAGSGLSWLGNNSLNLSDAVTAFNPSSAGSGAMDWTDLLGFDTSGVAGIDTSPFAGLDGYNAGAFMDSVLGSPASSAGSSFLTSLAAKGGGSLLGTVLGGLLGGVNGSKPAGMTTTNMAPWDSQQPFLLDAWNKAKQAANGSPLQTQANANYQSVLSGPTKNPYLGTDNPYLTKAIDYANEDTTRAMMPAMNQANRASGSFGNSGIADTFGRALTDQYWRNANSMRMQDYTNQQNLAQQQVNNTLGFTQNANTYAAQPSQNYAQTVQGSYGGSSSSPYFTNPLAGIMGGAAIGNKIGSLWG